MLVLLGAVLGAATGGSIAWRRNGRWADIAQYGVVYAMLFALAGLFLTLIIHRMTV